VVLPLSDDDISVVAEGTPPSNANQAANETLNVFCLAAGRPVRPISHPISPVSPWNPLAVAKSLSAVDAEATLNVIGKLAKTQEPLCSETEAAPDSALEVINTIGSAGSFPSALAVAPSEFDLALKMIGSVYGQFEASVIPQK